MGAWEFWIDRGGTFTDVVARDPAGALIARKLLSENPARYRDAAIAGIKSVLGIALDRPIPPGMIAAVKMGTTVATNALLERHGEPTLLVVNRGFADVLRIGNQTRPRLFDLAITLPTMLYRRVIEIAGRIGADGTEVEPLDLEATREAFARARQDGITACAIALMHAWKYPEHEMRVAETARAAGFRQVSASHRVSPLLRLIPRADTTVADAYLSPVLARYISEVATELEGTRLYFMQSNGGLAAAGHFQGKDAVLSGPAAGIVGAVASARRAGFERVITFDMGGTSTDVALYAGRFERSFERTIAGVRIGAPMLAINTVAAGGGSILSFDQGRFRVGPQSAGADPGPACYRNGGPLTVTDANVCLGRIQPRHFPAIFGPNADQPLDARLVRTRFAQLAHEAARASGAAPAEPRALAEGFLAIAVANMANAIKEISVAKGYDATRCVLACFGGAAGQHACAVADALAIDTIFLHPLAGVLSAYGMGLAAQTMLREQAVEITLEATSFAPLDALAERLAQEARAALIAEGADGAAIAVRKFVHLRYAGTEAALPVTLRAAPAMREEFTQRHRARFGFATPERTLIAATVTIEAAAAAPPCTEAALAERTDDGPRPIDHVLTWSNGREAETPVFARGALRRGDRIAGPALIVERHATTFLQEGWQATVVAGGSLVLTRTAARAFRHPRDTRRPDPILLELYNNLFMTIAEQAGAVLQNTALSVNIRERLDFSCAVFDRLGNLVANAPHIPVHLGAMGESVKTVLARRGGRLAPGDVIALNNPYNGGTHLPDVTVVTPVFDPAGKEIRFFVGSRGHHADIGGITPGSTPPNSRTLAEEGVVIDDFLLVHQGEFRERELRELLTRAQFPARNPDANIADMKAQVAANEKAAQELARTVAEHGWETVHRYMGYVMDNAEESVRRVIARIGDGHFEYVMDDGSRIVVAVRVDHAARSAIVDFTGTSPERDDNFNAPAAVTRAAALYVFRCLVGEDIPLNDGCLKPIRLIIPERTFLSPAPGHAVVAGNTEVSQAVCNALFGAIGAIACSQATMNNFLFGDARRQYYETICGGTGAGPTFEGASAVHSHMTNTRMTDPEVLELNYPVRVERFAIRTGSGGKGRHRGGDGSVRKIRFLEPMTAVIVASRRTVAPFGLAGGEDAQPGRQWVERADGSVEVLPGTAAAELSPNDAFVIETPGGGGYGDATES